MEVLIVQSVSVVNGSSILCLTDEKGFIVTQSEARGIIAGIMPFYTEVSADQIDRYNRDLYKQYFPNPGGIVARPQRNQAKEKETPGFVYVLRSGPYYKIGRATDLKARLSTISTQVPVRPELVLQIQTASPAYLERTLHNTYADKRINGEWFALTEQDLDQIRAIKERT